MITLRCVVERITYQNPENGYTVLRAAVRNYKELVTVVGNLLDVNVGSVLLLQGDWKVDPKYGNQFCAEKWEETMPATVYGIEKYLGSGLIRGVGPKFAGRIVRTFGTDTLTVIEEETDRLLLVPGIGEKRVQMIRDSWEKQKEIKNIMLFLQSHSVSTSFAAKIYKVYGNESIQVVRENPYRLADDIWGVGFKTADGLAEKLGFAKDDPLRCRSGILYTLNALADEGHVYAEQELLLRKAEELLEAKRESISAALEAMLGTEDLKQDGEAIYLPPFYYAEIGVAAKLKRLAADTDGLPSEARADFERLAKKTGLQYDEIQKDAILKATVSKVMVLTGGPGTGKTTTTLGMIAVLRSRGKRILLAAPTGRAAKRMTETTGMEARTIHRLLEFKPPEGYQRNEENRLVGDVDQLPSVGAGNVLRDIIDSGVFPVVRLTRIFRQAQSSRIILNAHRINAGEFPDLSNGAGTDFFFVPAEEPETAAQEIVRLVKIRLPKYRQVLPTEIQVLTPMQRGAVGASNLNTLLQEALNPSETCLRRSGYSFRLYDKVMQIRNNYDKEVFNGDVGTISALNPEERNLRVRFDDREVEYDVTELDELAQAYAVTIHKSQGSEYPIVVMPMLMTHFVMLQRNLLYTGVTRAKKLLVLVGTKKAVGYAVRNVTVTSRNTRLKERLQGE